MVALGILTVALAGASHIFSMGLETTYRMRVRATARQLAKDLMEEVLSKEPWKREGICGSSTLSAETGETRFGTTADTVYDDVGDYNNYTETPPKAIDGTALSAFQGFQRSVTVQYLDPVTLAVSAAQTDYQQITVTVKYSPQNVFTSPVATYSLSQILTAS